MLTFRLCPIITDGLDWLKEIATDEELEFPIVTFIIPQEVMSVEHTVIEVEPVVLVVVKFIFEPEMLVCTNP